MTESKVEEPTSNENSKNPQWSNDRLLITYNLQVKLLNNKKLIQEERIDEYTI